ncbi:type II toxin-antitoxin system antitoxin HipB [Vibrio cortegadensis]|uniref:Type II toxin-antitoxin system antitoxin HipB n=1 Tax=Vibrio cortegadensis TaxID=1328770 RepID=A0ABV4MBM4_9VIBR|nr:hypothetical protein DS893_05755 [Vibrionales bacterium C3R12]
MIYSPKQLADRMLLIRRKNGWTQSELAKEVGIKRATISNFENNPNKTTISTLFRPFQPHRGLHILSLREAHSLGKNPQKASASGQLPNRQLNNT